jgi:hypothetical protein
MRLRAGQAGFRRCPGLGGSGVGIVHRADDTERYGGERLKKPLRLDPATVDHQRLAGNRRRTVGGEEHDRVGDLGGVE